MLSPSLSLSRLDLSSSGNLLATKSTFGHLIHLQNLIWKLFFGVTKTAPHEKATLGSAGGREESEKIKLKLELKFGD